MRILEIMRSAKDITLSSLPKLLKLLSIEISVSLSDNVKVTVGGINKKNTEDADKAAQAQVAELKKKAEELGMTDKQLIDKLKEGVKKQLKNNDKELVYCSGIIIYTSDDYKISEDVKEALRSILNTDVNYFDEEAEELYETESNIKEFLYEYAVVDNCEINEDSIGITFEWSAGMSYDGYMDFEYSHEMMDAIKRFISNLNDITSKISDESEAGPYFDFYVPF